MDYLLVSIMAAMAMAMTVYAETTSLSLTLIAYAATGTVVLTTFALSAWFERSDF